MGTSRYILLYFFFAKNLSQGFTVPQVSKSYHGRSQQRVLPCGRATGFGSTTLCYQSLPDNNIMHDNSCDDACLISAINDLDCVMSEDSSEIYGHLFARLALLEAGIGKRSVCDDEDPISDAKDLDCVVSDIDSSVMYGLLYARVARLQAGIGKRYVCRTQHGRLNVHEDPNDPRDYNKVVGQLVEGQIVTSTGPSQGPWICHDGGGWSISKHGALTWLEAVQE
jgi:hypothetical protein